MWNRAIAERYWAGKPRYWKPRKETGMRYYVIDRESARYFEKADGSRVWHLTREQAMKISEGAIVVALDERNFNESLNAYYEQELFCQLHWDERNGWIS